MREDPSAGIQRDATIDGLLHLHLANILLAQRYKDLATKERTSALALLDQPDEPSANKYKLVSEVEPAEFQLRRGDSSLALATLDPVIQLLPKSQDKFFSLRCRKLLGDIYLGLGQHARAITQYQKAIDLAEASLDGITQGLIASLGCGQPMRVIAGSFAFFNTEKRSRCAGAMGVVSEPPYASRLTCG